MADQIERLKSYLNITDCSKDSLLITLQENAVEALEDYTGTPATKHGSIVFKMMLEDYNRYGSEGISSLSFGSGKESILEDYSAGLQRQIRRLKKVRVL